LLQTLFSLQLVVEVEGLAVIDVSALLVVVLDWLDMHILQDLLWLLMMLFCLRYSDHSLILVIQVHSFVQPILILLLEDVLRVFQRVFGVSLVFVFQQMVRHFGIQILLSKRLLSHDFLKIYQVCIVVLVFLQVPGPLFCSLAVLVVMVVLVVLVVLPVVEERLG
jgi:hypothetical protein